MTKRRTGLLPGRGRRVALCVMADDAPTLLAVRVIARARRNEVSGERDGRLVVRTTAAPVDGAANASVCGIVATHLGIASRRVTVESGRRSRDKVLRISP